MRSPSAESLDVLERCRWWADARILLASAAVHAAGHEGYCNVGKTDCLQLLCMF